MNAKIIIVYGPSSAGKSTLIKALRKTFTESFCHYGVDLFAEQFHPVTVLDAPTHETQRFFRGFHRSIIAFANEGIDLIVEYVPESEEQADDLRNVLQDYAPFWVKLSAQDMKLREREKDRGDRPRGSATGFAQDFCFSNNDMTFDTTDGISNAVIDIVDAWRAHAAKTASS